MPLRCVTQRQRCILPAWRRAGAGDFLWTSPNTFVASANCARYCGAQVDFVDIDPHTWNMDAGLLASKLEAAERNGTLPKVVVVVAFAGQSADLQVIAELAERYGFVLIEDAAHAVGRPIWGVQWVVGPMR